MHKEPIHKEEAILNFSFFKEKQEPVIGLEFLQSNLLGLGLNIDLPNLILFQPN